MSEINFASIEGNNIFSFITRIEKMSYSPDELFASLSNAKEYTFTSPLLPGEYFSTEPDTPLPPFSAPIIDDESGICLGYARKHGGGLYDIFDAEGKLVTYHELPLESSLIDPIDILFLGALLYKGVRLGFHTFEALTKRRIAVKFSSVFTEQIIGMLRGRLKVGLSAKMLKFTPTPARHMSEAGRYVPVYILEKAIRYGKRLPDIKGNSVRILKRYEIKIRRSRYNDTDKIFENKDYTLEVIVDERTWTITHFAYKS